MLLIGRARAENGVNRESLVGCRSSVAGCVLDIDSSFWRNVVSASVICSSCWLLTYDSLIAQSTGCPALLSLVYCCRRVLYKYAVHFL